MYRPTASALCFLFVATLLLSCNSPENNKPQPAAKADLRQTMVEQLDSLARYSVPMENYQLNSLRAEYWREQAAQQTELGKQISARFQMANELLNAGKLEDAILEMSKIAQQLGGQLNDQTKMLYELLAIAYLRLGEQQNCVDNHNPASCILPLKEEGWHQLKQGSEQAIALYEQILAAYPDDLQSRWLLNIAYMTLGQYPHGVPTKFRIPTAAFTSAARDFPEFKDVAISLGLDVEGLSGGAIMEDFNNDGRLDIFATSYGLRDQCRLFFQQADGSFEDVTAAAGLTGLFGGLNTLQADYDNDGKVDILILRGGWLNKGGKLPNSLLHNNGDGTFTDVTEAAGLLTYHPTQTAAWADFDGDGYLDLFIGNESSKQDGVQLSHPCELYHNRGDGTFENVAAQTGLNFTAFVKGCAWSDVNNDGRPDLFVSVLGNANRLYLNRGGHTAQDWQFEEKAAAAGVQEPVFSFPTWFFDYDNDGFEDLFVSGYDLRRLNQVSGDAAAEYLGQSPQAEYPRLFRNNGNETFTDVTAATGLDKVMYGMGCNFGDLDNDGYLDFYVATGAPDFRAIVPNRMFRNVGGQRFEEVTMDGFGHIQKGHGIAFGDYDRDGDQDIYCTMGGAFEGDVAHNVLYQNPGAGNDWLVLDLKGAPVIGARVKVTVHSADGKERSFYRTAGSGASFGASSLQVEVGLGKAESVVAVEVAWPGKEGPVSKYEGLAKDQYHVLRK
ncbi:MAG: CRTAC1 family protein [Saprospiraceae bacterium]|nr:CRTAC1 family protein [Saprospiraceae bacterium]